MDALTQAVNRIDMEMPHWRDVRLPTIPTLKELLGDAYTPEIIEKFPDVQPPVYPTGINILVQLRVPGKFIVMPNGKKLWIPDESQIAEQARAQTALVRAVGPAAYRNRQSLILWPEGHWCVPGQFIRTPMYGGDRMEVPFRYPEEDVNTAVLFVTFRDQDCLGVVTGNPLTIKTS